MAKKKEKVEFTKEGHNCGNCYFYHNGDGECRRYAPRPVWQYQVKREVNSGKEDDFDFNHPWWPVMGGDDWCGEFKKDPEL